MDKKKKKVSVTDGGETAIAAVIEASKGAGVERFMYAFFEEGPDGAKLATCRLNEIRPRDAMTLALMAFEQAIEHEKGVSKDAPREYHRIMDTLMFDVANASKKANDALRAFQEQKKGV